MFNKARADDAKEDNFDKMENKGIPTQQKSLLEITKHERLQHLNMI